MGSSATFLWGCVGGLLAYVLVFALPEFAYMIETGAVRVDFTLLRLVGYAGMFVVYIALAGAAAVLVGGADQAR
jgi:hypothetical protein